MTSAVKLDLRLVLAELRTLPPLSLDSSWRRLEETSIWTCASPPSEMPSESELVCSQESSTAQLWTIITHGPLMRWLVSLTVSWKKLNSIPLNFVKLFPSTWPSAILQLT